VETRGFDATLKHPDPSIAEAWPVLRPLGDPRAQARVVCAPRSASLHRP
jgi:hypothetical protein